MTIYKHTPVEVGEIVRQFISKYVAMSDEELAAVARVIEIRHFDKKTIVTRQGEIEAYLNMVAKGLARKYFIHPKKKEEQVIHLAKEGDFICNLESFTSVKPSPSVIETIEPTTFLCISKQKLDDLYLRIPKVERLGRLVITQQFIENEHWEYNRSLYNSQERFIHFVNENADLIQRVPQKILASYLNIKPETFSRLKHLLRAGQ